jgi:hypothetical protein
MVEVQVFGDRRDGRRMELPPKPPSDAATIADKLGSRDMTMLIAVVSGRLRVFSCN